MASDRPLDRRAGPIATYVAPTGLRVESYNDAVDTEARLRRTHERHAPRGGGAVHHDPLRLRPDDVCDISAKVRRHWGSYRALCYVAYQRGWTEGHEPLPRVRPRMEPVQRPRRPAGSRRSPTTSKSAASPATRACARRRVEPQRDDRRGLPAAVRLRECLRAPQDNQEIPPASQVPGLREYLSGAFTQAPAPTPAAAASARPPSARGQSQGQRPRRRRWSATVKTDDPGRGDSRRRQRRTPALDDGKSASGDVRCTTSATGTCDASST